MTPEELCERLKALPFGGVELQTQAQFDRTFRVGADLDQRKAAAVALGERCGCRVLFIGTDNIFVRFTRRQDRATLKLVYGKPSDP